VLFGLLVVRTIGLTRAQEATAQHESVLRESALRTESEVRGVRESFDSRDLGYEAAHFAGRCLLDDVPEEDRALVEPGRPPPAMGRYGLPLLPPLMRTVDRPARCAGADEKP
jgi:hypothetical protein